MVGTVTLSGRIQGAGDQVEYIGTSLEVLRAGSRAEMSGTFATLLNVAMTRATGIGSNVKDVTDQIQNVGTSLQIA
jgi:hypothetical protein